MKKLLALTLIVLFLPALAFCDEAPAEFSFPGVFLEEGEEPIKTEWTYQSADIAFTITPQRLYESDVYVVDLYVRRLDCFRRGFSGGKWNGGNGEVSTIAEDNDALLAITGDSCTFFTSGWVIANGEIYRSKDNQKRDLGVLYKTGEMDVWLAKEGEISHTWLQENNSSIWHTFLFGPVLVRDGQALASFNDKNNICSDPNPRSAVGYFEPGHYVLVQADGRRTASKLESKATNRGLTGRELADFMADLGCVCAYNLDGGGSSVLWYDGEYVSTPSASRHLRDAIIIREAE